MTDKKRNQTEVKTELHPRNKHRARYDFEQLSKANPELSDFVSINKYGDESIDFFNPEAVKALNKALLGFYYDVSEWDIPAGYLCPPIPGRADYIHHIADLLGGIYSQPPTNTVPHGASIKCLDVGVGSNCVYPIVGAKEYGWSFIGSDTDPKAMRNAKKILKANPFLAEHISLRSQANPSQFFKGIVKENEFFHLTLCNPPFHASKKEADEASLRKLSNLKGEKISTAVRNFGGKSTELWCKGGEVQFVRDMIFESKEFAQSCLWFTTLISKHENLDAAYSALDEVGAVSDKTMPMGQGHKVSRILAWTFHNDEQQKLWKEKRDSQ
tara:strand:- start:3329 stop:4309 length:981 start_codon:yes stop_codon:yes gene_type:complete